MLQKFESNQNVLLQYMDYRFLPNVLDNLLYHYLDVSENTIGYYSREMDGFEYYHWEFKLKNLYKNAREVDFGAGYSNVLKQATYGSVK